ncbi:MAG TPA: type II toxin-antitoxin system RelE/ParE family toxin [Thermoguttaceae bacterium]|nr:type II toxin-antitoxin system RelE/ParE family toxin [Thermoguttaceae bacterium]
MSRPTLEIHPEAIEEARAARQWYHEHSPAAADAFVAELDAAIERILDAPDRFPVYLAGTRRYLMHRFPYIVVYHQVRSTVQVIAVAHGKRKPGYWKSRSKE